MDGNGRRLTLSDHATPPPTDRRPAEAGSPVPPSLDAREELLAVVRGIGSVMFLTSDRIIVTRDGYERRPRSGVQSFPHERIGRVRIERGSAGSGRIVVWSAGDVESASMFFEARARDRADELVALASAQVARARRRTVASGGVASPASPAPRGKSDGSAGPPRRGV
jgi:hypothetical protein